jgi:hypothetical protein
MQHYEKFEHSRVEPLVTAELRHGATARMLAAMAEPDPMRPGRHVFAAYARESREGGRAYFGRRSDEERAAACRAAGVEARQAHRALSALYGELADALAAPWQRRRANAATRAAIAPESRAERQDALLDSALMETFPASDPVSVVRVG